MNLLCNYVIYSTYKDFFFCFDTSQRQLLTGIWMHEWWMDEQCDVELNSVDKMDEKQGMYFSQTQMGGQHEEFLFSNTSQRH